MPATALPGDLNGDSAQAAPPLSTIGASDGSLRRDEYDASGSEGFCEALLEEERLVLVPGTAFGADAHVRLSYALDEARRSAVAALQEKSELVSNMDAINRTLTALSRAERVDHAIAVVNVGTKEKEELVFCDPTISYGTPGVLSPSSADRDVLAIVGEKARWLRSPEREAGFRRLRG